MGEGGREEWERSDYQGFRSNPPFPPTVHHYYLRMGGHIVPTLLS